MIHPSESIDRVDIPCPRLISNRQTPLSSRASLEGELMHAFT